MRAFRILILLAVAQIPHPKNQQKKDIVTSHAKRFPFVVKVIGLMLLQA